MWVGSLGFLLASAGADRGSRTGIGHGLEASEAEFRLVGVAQVNDLGAPTAQFGWQGGIEVGRYCEAAFQLAIHRAKPHGPQAGGAEPQAALGIEADLLQLAAE